MKEQCLHGLSNSHFAVRSKDQTIQIDSALQQGWPGYPGILAKFSRNGRLFETQRPKRLQEGKLVALCEGVDTENR